LTDFSYIIFIVDDDNEDVFTLQKIFAETSPEIILTHFDRGEDLLNHLKLDSGNSPGLILLDLNMPKMGGYELLEILQQTPWAKIPVIVLTTSDRESDKVRSLALGAKLFQTKLVKLDELRKWSLELKQLLEAG